MKTFIQIPVLSRPVHLLVINSPRYSLFTSTFSQLNSFHNSVMNSYIWHSECIKYSDNSNDLLGIIQKIVNNLNEDTTYICMPKIFLNYSNSFIKLSKQIFLNKDSDPNDILDQILNGIDEKIGKNYIIDNGDNIYIEYRSLDTKIELKNKKKRLLIDNFLRIKKAGIKSKYFSEHYFPFSVKDESFGKLISTSVQKEGKENLFQYNEQYQISRLYINNKRIESKILLKTGNVLLSFTDIIFTDFFIRKINGLRLFINNNGELIKSEGDIKVDFIKKKKKSFPYYNNIITMDIETYIKDNLFIPYAIGFYDGTNVFSYYLTDFQNSEEMIIKAFKDLMIHKYKGYTVYFHNLQGFDGVLLTNLLEKKFDIKSQFKEGKKILKIKINSRKKEIESSKLGGKRLPRIFSLSIKDSYLLLPHSLRKLSESFNVEVKKGCFPYLFVNEQTLEYIGKTPLYKFYDQSVLTEKDYLKDFKEDWSTKEETLKYLKSDLISQYQVLDIFAHEIYTAYQLNIVDYLSLPSLSSSIYRAEFYKIENIPILKGKIYKDIRSSYIGGITDVFKPVGNNIATYDVNSLYPFAMKNDMPVGMPTYTTEKNLDKLFGFFYVTVETQGNLYIPTLPLKLDNGRVISPNGKFTGWYFSEELKDARNNYNYKITIHYGYQFKRSNDLFTSFVDTFYNIKNTSKGAKKIIAKLMLNSLYGRFGMKEYLDKTVILDHLEVNLLAKTHKILEINPLAGDNNKELIRYNIHPDELICLETGQDYESELLKIDGKRTKFNVSIGIAAAITSYARIYMNKFKHLPNNPPLYTDTDSICLEKPLDEKYIGSELGQFKLEYIADKAFFAGAKLYYLQIKESIPVIKAKGVGPRLDIDQFLDLIKGINITVTKEYWNWDIVQGIIKLENRKITLRAGLLKRNKVFVLGKWINTKAITVGNNHNFNGQIIEQVKLLTAPEKLLALPAPKKMDQGVSYQNQKNMINVVSPLKVNNNSLIFKFSKKNYSTKFKTIRIREIIEDIKDTENFKIAFTHKSCCNENNQLKSYETLEFLGDSILNLYTSLFIYNSFPNYSEGDMTQLWSQMVCGKNLAYLSKKIDLGKYLKLEKNLEKQINDGLVDNHHLFEDIFESFVATLYLEKSELILQEFLSLTVFKQVKKRYKVKN